MPQRRRPTRETPDVSLSLASLEEVLEEDVIVEAEVVEEDVVEAPLLRRTPLLTSSPALDLDPRLQRLVALRRNGGTTEATASTSPGEVAVTAVVTDLKAWVGLSEVREGAAFPVGGGETVVTGRIPLARIEVVKAQPFVRSLKAARPLKPRLGAGVKDARADAVTLATVGGRGGRGVVVGIVDYGCDFVHRNVRNAAGETRIEAIWHQGSPDTPGAPFGYGRVFEKAAIDAALRKTTPYATLGYAPAKDTPTKQGTHGTHVMDIAAGNGLGSGVPGFAPEASLIFVDVSSADIAWSGTGVLNVSFGDSVRLLEAVQYIFQRAGDRPCVVNISLGTNGGPHDGTTPVERGLDSLVAQAPNRAVVIAASNSFGDHIHASGTLATGQSVDLDWDRSTSDGAQDELEIWAAGPDRLAVELIMPDGTSLGVVEPGNNGEATESGETVILVSNRLDDPNNHDNMIGIYVRDDLPGGTWKVRLTARQATSGRFHAWIERDDYSQASFLTQVDDTHTIGSISCGRNTIVVASYDAHKADLPLSWFSSAGPTRDGRQKPELAAPGHDVAAAHSRTLTKVTRKSGTSMASPAVTGSVALLFGEALARGRKLSIAQTRGLLLGGLRKAGVGASGWNDRLGGGRLDVAAAIRALTANGGGGGPAPVTATTSAKAKKAKPRVKAPA